MGAAAQRVPGWPSAHSYYSARDSQYAVDVQSPCNQASDCRPSAAFRRLQKVLTPRGKDVMAPKSAVARGPLDFANDFNKEDNVEKRIAFLKRVDGLGPAPRHVSAVRHVLVWDGRC
jgi:hypothetical protein